MGSSGAPGARSCGELAPLAQRQANRPPRARLPVFSSVPTDWAGFRRGFKAFADGQRPDAVYLLHLKAKIPKEGQKLLAEIRFADEATATGGSKEKVGLS